MTKILVATSLAGLLTSASAQVPHILTYQGRVTSNGAGFTGIGKFKFALVSGRTNLAVPATAVASVVNGFLVGIRVTAGGMGYTSVPLVTITDPGGSGAMAIASISNGAVIDITVVDAGSGYSTSPVVLVPPPTTAIGYDTYWSNDGSSVVGSEPGASVPAEVSQGIFSVLLGDTSIPTMKAIAAEVFSNPDVRLRIWFSDGTGGFQHLVPDQRLTAVAYAMVADTVRDGSITSSKLASNAVTAAQLAPRSVGANQLADGSVTVSKLAPNLNLGVPSGSFLLSSDPSSSNLVAAGYNRAEGLSVSPPEWQQFLPPGFPLSRRSHTMVWTGTEMILWGGESSDGRLNDGGKYTPSLNNWARVSTNGAPSARSRHNALWTGSEMLVWGGDGFIPGVGSTSFADGGRYNSSLDRWNPITAQNAPVPRLGGSFSAIWTGAEMIVWGGRLAQNPSLGLNSGGRYNPSNDLWTSVSTGGAPTPRSRHAAVWTGAEMIIWGGNDPQGGPAVRGGRYRAASNDWMSMATNGAPPLSGDTRAVWTGIEMVVWERNNGRLGRYNPAADSWDTADARVTVWGEDPSILWTGTEVIMFGSCCGAGFGARFLPASGAWLPMSRVGAPEEDFAQAVWTGNAMLMFGGEPNGSCIFRYAPTAPLYLYQKP